MKSKLSSKNRGKKEHYHGLLAPCPYSKFKKVKLPILSYEGKVLKIFEATRYIPCDNL